MIRKGPCRDASVSGEATSWEKEGCGGGVKTKHLKQTRTQERTDAEEMFLRAFVLVSLEKSALLQRCCAQG